MVVRGRIFYRFVVDTPTQRLKIVTVAYPNVIQRPRLQCSLLNTWMQMQCTSEN